MLYGAFRASRREFFGAAITACGAVPVVIAWTKRLALPRRVVPMEALRSLSFRVLSLRVSRVQLSRHFFAILTIGGFLQGQGAISFEQQQAQSARRESRACSATERHAKSRQGPSGTKSKGTSWRSPVDLFPPQEEALSGPLERFRLLESGGAEMDLDFVLHLAILDVMREHFCPDSRIH